MHRFILLLILAAQIAVANEIENEKYFINGKELKFYLYKKARVTTSLKCDELLKEKFCSDLKFLNDITLKKAGQKGTGEINPGSVICKKLLKGTVFIALDSEKNENSFCKLKKDIYISNGTLTYYGLKNQGDIDIDK